MKYHLIGDQGISMSAIAEYLHKKGDIVTGSDLKTTGHRASNITKDIDVVVRTSAVNQNSEGWVEVLEAKKLGIPVIKRSQLIGRITQNCKLIAISGMHGKTTTTSLIGLVLIEAGLDPTVLVGEKIREFNDKALWIGNSEYFVLEACEYDRSFFDFKPDILILTNIEEEHLDTYPGGIEEIMNAFSTYLNNIKDGGVIIANYEDHYVKKLINNTKLPKVKVIWYGKGSGNNEMIDLDLSLEGEHNYSNALAALAVADLLNIDHKICDKVFISFKGAKRRLEYLGEYNNALLYDDYGHHPTEIKATIAALKNKYPDRKLFVIFWPHQYKRILPLIDKFSESFSGAEEVFIKKIFFVPGRDEVLDVNSKDIAELIEKHGIKATAFDENEEIFKRIAGISKEECVILTIGIPPIYKLLEELIGD